MANFPKTSEPARMAVNVIAHGTKPPHRIEQILDAIQEASAMLEARAVGDGLRRMSDEELIAWGRTAFELSRAIDALLLELQAEMARRIRQNPQRFKPRQVQS
jgi:hypothetical protein